MKYSICKHYSFNSAHWLPKLSHTHPCSHIHGHTYEVEVRLSGPLDDKGWICDFSRIDAMAQQTFAVLDHRILNERIPNPTSENIAMFIYDNLIKHLPVSSIRVWESPKSWAEVTP